MWKPRGRRGCFDFICPLAWCWQSSHLFLPQVFLPIPSLSSLFAFLSPCRVFSPIPSQLVSGGELVSAPNPRPSSSLTMLGWGSTICSDHFSRYQLLSSLLLDLICVCDIQRRGKPLMSRWLDWMKISNQQVSGWNKWRWWGVSGPKKPKSITMSVHWVWRMKNGPIPTSVPRLYSQNLSPRARHSPRHFPALVESRKGGD